MKRLFFVFCIIIVLGVVGFYCWMEFSIPEISYVNDTITVNSRGNESAVRRLYTSGTDFQELSDKLDSSLLTTEFSEEEIAAAALASGTPEFYPAFYTNVYQLDDSFKLTGWVQQEMTVDQPDADFNITNLRLEAVLTGLQATKCSTVKLDSYATGYSEPIVSADGRSLTIDMANVRDFSIEFSGTSGTVMLQYRYDISTATFIPRVVKQDQLLVLYAKISIDDNGKFAVEYLSEPYSTTEDLG